MTTDTAPISREALRLAREQRHLSQRELGRRVAARVGRDEATRAFQVRLSRLETGDAITQTDRELVDALAAELAVGRDDLGGRPYYAWMQATSGVPTLIELGLRQLLFTTPENAVASRDWLAHASGGTATPMKEARLYPFYRGALDDIVGASFGTDLTPLEREVLEAIDPNADAMMKLWGLQQAMEGNDDYRDVAAEEAVDNPWHLMELAILHSLALRRRRRASEGSEWFVALPPEMHRQIAREEEGLFDILDRAHALRGARREGTTKDSASR